MEDGISSTHINNEQTCSKKWTKGSGEEREGREACAVEIVLGSVQRRYRYIGQDHWVIYYTKDLLTFHNSEWVGKWAGF